MNIWSQLESDFIANLATIPAPLPVERDPGFVDVTPDTLADRDVVEKTRAHIDSWKANKGAIR